LSTGKIIPFPFERRIAFPRMKVYTLRVYLVSGPGGRDRQGEEIYRALKIRGDQTLEDLHYAILGSFEREQADGYAFFPHEGSCGPESVRYRCSGEAEDGRDPADPDREEPPLSGFATLDSLHLTTDRAFRYRLRAGGTWRP